MKKTSTKTTFKMNGWIYTYNEPMTSNWGWPEGRKGERVRILKKDMLQLLKERDYFKTPYTEEPAEAPQTAGEKPVEEVEEKAPETAQESADEATEEEKTGLTVSVPLMAVGAGNLTKLLEAKGSLIKKALGADDIRFVINEKDHTVEFPWWNDIDAFMNKPEELTAYTTFIAYLCKMSKDAKRITAKPAEAESEKYAFRCFLLRLGFIGPQYKNARKILLQNLSGSAAFVTKEKADAFSAAQKAKRDATKEVEE